MVIGDVVDWIITVGFTGIAFIFGYVFHRLHDTRKEMTDYQRETERRLGEFIRREELNSILDRVEERMEKQLNDMKDMLRKWLDRTDH